MKRVLLISNQPLDGTGGRAGKFRTRTELLPDHGWEVVFCHAPGGLRSLPLNWCRAWRLARREDVDAVQSVCNPPAHPLVGLVVSVLAGLPWLLVYRDPIVTNPDVEPGSLSWYQRRIVEWLYVRFADRVAWIDGIQLAEDYFSETYPGVSDSTWIELPYMGFVQESFSEAPTTAYDDVTITYAGSFYEGWIEPFGLLEGVDRYRERNPDVDFTLQFYGDWAPEYQRVVDDRGLCDSVESHEFVPYEEIVPKLKGSDVVVHVGGTDPRNRRNIPSKIWDYIGSRTPILALVDPSFAVSTLIEEQDLGIVASPDDPDAIARALERLVSNTAEYTPDDPVAGQFTRDRHLDAMASALDETVAAYDGRLPR